MKYVVFFVIVGAIAVGLWRSQKKSAEEREAREKATADAFYAKQEQKYQEQRQQLYEQARGKREEALRENAPVRERLAREHPDAWRELGQKAGGSLDECVVTARDWPTPAGYDKWGKPIKQVMLSAKCGPSLEESFYGN